MRIKGDLRLVSGVLATPFLMVKGIDSSVKSVRGAFFTFLGKAEGRADIAGHWRQIDADDGAVVEPQVAFAV